MGRPDVAALERRLAVPAEAGRFDAAEVAGLDEPVRRHLLAAIAPGAPLARAARLAMRGHVRLGRWLPFRAHQVVAPHHGFVWAARVAGVVVGSDHAVDGHGALDWRLLGVVPLVHQEGSDVARSSAGRGGAEGIWAPTALLPRFGVTWSAEDDHHLTARYQCGTVPIELHLALDDAGLPRDITFDRWGDPDETGTWGWHRFRVAVTAHRRFGHLTVPAEGVAGWCDDPDRWEETAFLRYGLTDVAPVPAS